jgi:hypothetical protein
MVDGVQQDSVHDPGPAAEMLFVGFTYYFSALASQGRTLLRFEVSNEKEPSPPPCFHGLFSLIFSIILFTWR